MRRKDRFLAGNDVGVSGKCKQRVGVDDERPGRFLDKTPNDFLRPLVSPEPGSDDDRACVARRFQQRVDDGA